MDGDQVRLKKTESRTKWRDCGVALETFPRLIFGVRIFFFSKSRRVSCHPLSCPVRNPHPLALALALALPPTLTVPPSLSLLPSLSPLTSLSPSPSLSLSSRVPPTFVLGPSTTPHGYGNPY